jgi:hypothetical protein
MQRGQIRRALPTILAALRRRQADEAAQPQPQPQSDRDQASRQGPVADSGWRRVPPVRVAIRSRPVLVAGPLLRPPEVSGTRSLLTREPRDRDAASAHPQIARPRRPGGRVTGLVVPRAAPAIGGANAAAPALEPGGLSEPRGPSEPAPAPSPARLRPPVRATAARRQNLIEATGEFVGAPQPEETPYSSSAWLRMLQAYRLPVGGSDLADAPLPGLSQAVKPDGGTVAVWSSTVAAPPPRQVAPPAAGPAAAPPGQAERPPRASLAESRRLGLGSPLSRPPRPSSAAPAADTTPAAGPPPSGRPARAGLGAPIARDAGPDRPGPDIGGPDDGRAELTSRAPVRPDSAAPLTAGRAVPRPRVRPEPIPSAEPGRGPLPPASSPAPPEPSPAIPSVPASRTGLTDLTPGASDIGGTDPRQPVQDEDRTPAPRPLIVVPVYRAVPPAPPATAGPRPDGRPLAGPLRAASATYRPVAPPARTPGPNPPATPDQPASAARPRPARPPSAADQDRAVPRMPGPVVTRLMAAQPGASDQGTGQPASARTKSSASPAQQPDSPAYRSPAPPDLADALRRAHGIDVSDVLVIRAPLAGQHARRLGARAFAQGGEVILPPEAGPIERPQTRALLAHELTHAAQQRALGPSLPAEDSAAGVVLERQAREVERRVLCAQPPPAEQEERRPPWPPPAALPVPPAMPAPPGPSASVQRQTEELAVGGLGAGAAFDPFALLPQQPVTEPPARPAELGADQSPPVPLAPAPDEGFGSARARLLTIAGQRLLDLDDSVAVGNLADGIYRRVRARLRHELLVDRERSGLLSDFR